MQAAMTSITSENAMINERCLRSMTTTVSDPRLGYNAPVIEVGELRRRLLTAVAVVSALGLLVEIWHVRSHGALVEALLPKLSLSYEGNVPTWFSSSLLLCC